MSDEAERQQDAPAADPALEGGNYEVIRERLRALGEELGRKADALNERRQQTFGKSELTVVGTARVRTENNCVPRDIVAVGGRLLFGYHVFLGLKRETAVADVFSLHDFRLGDDGFELEPLPAHEGGGFLDDERFVKDFKDLFRYYRDTELTQLRLTETRLLAVFRIGQGADDLKVFRWRIEPDGGLTYIDNRGDRDNVLPPAHDFEWISTTREDQVHGVHPHVNILDTVFVETVGGDLTIKIEDNTESGEGIYAEPVAEPNQTLDDAEIRYARLGALILLDIKPYREERHRYLVFDEHTQQVVRIDAIGQCCQRLPEDHGIIFPGGYYLQDGAYKVFEGDIEGMEFVRALRAPNGEDVLYVFHRRHDGHYILCPYNLIRKEVQTPVHCHGWSLFDDGRLIVFRATSDEPTRVHPMQIWQTPFCSVEHAAAAPGDGSFLSKVGNADLVRGISDAYSIRRLIRDAAPSRRTYEDLIAATARVADAYYWLGHADVGDLKSTLDAIRHTAELVIDEFEKVVALRERAARALSEAEAEQEALFIDLRPEDWSRVEQYVEALSALRRQRGHLITLREVRYIDRDRLDQLEAEVVDRFDRVSRAAVDFLSKDEALAPLTRRLNELLAQAEAVERAADAAKLQAEVEGVAEGLDLLSEVVAGLEIDDAAARTRILERVSEVYAHVNRVRATVEGRRKRLAGAEQRAEFAVQFQLFGQAVQAALARCETPEACDEQLTRLLVQLEELEGRFSDLDEFLGDLAARREEVNEAFAARKQTLLDERQRRVANLVTAADRILEGVARRARSFADEDDLNAWFAGDAMVLKLRRIADQLRGLSDPVKADELEARLKTARQDALRALRDRVDLFEEAEGEGGPLIKLGRHRFSVNTRPLELTLVPRDDGMALHLTGTAFYEPVDDPQFAETRPFWAQTVVSEDETVYRGEYLAVSTLWDAEAGRAGRSIEGLLEAAREDGGLLKAVRAYAADRYDEGYERGVHDADAARILDKLLGLRQTAGLLRFGPPARTLAGLLWADPALADGRERWRRTAASLGRARETLGDAGGLEDLAGEIAARFAERLDTELPPGLDPADAATAARYLVEELARGEVRFVAGGDAVALRDALLDHLDRHAGRDALLADLDAQPGPFERFALARAWLAAFAARRADVLPAERRAPGVVVEAAGLLATPGLDRAPSNAVTHVTVHGLLGRHPRIVDGDLELRLEKLLPRLERFRREIVPGFLDYRRRRQALVDRARARLRVDEYRPRVMSAFVRNRLIDEVYLPLIGDNLAKQIGAAGEAKRTDLMGLLLLISPPGYGKTTLMEYVASRLGLAFVKVNGPALGHGVTSLDPAEAPNATARQEVEKVNLALEMGDNVMLYLDDIQHTHPELLQKFISLCDAQRRIEGVWRGRTRTYDLRGRKFCVVMAGNPYTESGEKFQIPDMLANRADTYNLGDILEGKEDLFALSYLENALTSNATLAPLAARRREDVHKIIRMARGEEIPANELSYDYPAVELEEMKAIFRHLLAVQEVLLKVNQAYIASASQDDAYRTEPPFKLQGSYRNMNKLAEKVVPAMTAEERERLIDDHYLSEAQTLTTGAEQNLLKLAEIRGRLTEEQAARWAEIKAAFRRVKLMGGRDDDPVARVTGSLALLGEQLDGIQRALAGVGGGREIAERIDSLARGLELAIRTAAAKAARPGPDLEALAPHFEQLAAALRTLSRPQVEVRVDNRPPPGVDELLAQQVAIVERTLVPLVKTATKHLDDSTALRRELSAILDGVRALEARLGV